MSRPAYLSPGDEYDIIDFLVQTTDQTFAHPQEMMQEILENLLDFLTAPSDDDNFYYEPEDTFRANDYHLYKDNATYYFSRTAVIQGLRRINEYFTAMLLKRIELWSAEELRKITQICDNLYGWLGVATEKKRVLEQTPTGEKETFVDEELPEMTKLAMALYFNYYTKPEARSSNPTQKDELNNLYDYLLVARYEYALSQLKDEVKHNKTKEELYKLVHPRANDETQAFCKFVIVLLDVAHVLREHADSIPKLSLKQASTELQPTKQVSQRSLFSSVLGYGIHQKTGATGEVTIGDVERRSGVYVLGKPGMGKSNLIVNMILQDIEHGHGLCFIDPHGDAIEDVLQRLPGQRKDDVIYFNPLDKTHAFGLNLFQCNDPTDNAQVSRTLDFVLQVFGKLFTESGDINEAPMMELTLRNLTILLIFNPTYTMAQIPTILEYEEAREKLIHHIPDDYSDVSDWWIRYNRLKPTEQDQITASTKSRIGRFLTDINIRFIVGQPQTTINFQEIMDTGKILLVKLPQKQAQLTTLVGSLIIGQLLNAAYSRDEIPEEQRRQFCLYCDEFQNFTTPDFAKLITEGRKYRIATMIAHQERVGQFIENKIILGATTAAASMVLFQPTVKDAEEFAPLFAKAPPPGEPVREMMTEPATETYTVWEWTSQDAEQEFKNAVQELKRLSTYGCALGGCGCIGHVTREGDDETGDGRKISEYGRPEGWIVQLEYDLEDWKRYKERMSHILELTSKMCNIDFQDEQVRAYLMANVYATYEEDKLAHQPILMKLTKDTIITLRNPRVLEYRFPPDLPSKWENSINEIKRFRHSHPEHEEKFRAELRSELLDSIKKRAVYHFDPTGKTDQFPFVYANHTNPRYNFRDSECRRREETYWKVPIWSEAIEWIIEKAKRIIQEADQWQAKRDTLRREHYKQVTHVIYLGYDVPKKRIVGYHGRYGLDPIEEQMYEWKEGAPTRTEADMVGEMKRELINLPPYTAYCNIVKVVNGKKDSGKYELHPYRLRAADDEAIVQKRREEILTNTRQYCTDREEIKREIAARRAELLKKKPRIAQATRDEEEEVS